MNAPGSSRKLLPYVTLLYLLRQVAESLTDIRPAISAVGRREDVLGKQVQANVIRVCVTRRDVIPRTSQDQDQG